MTRHYSHPRLAARRAAVEALSVIRPEAQTGQIHSGYVTNYVTKQLPAHVEAS